MDIWQQWTDQSSIALSLGELLVCTFRELDTYTLNKAAQIDDAGNLDRILSYKNIYQNHWNLHNF